MLSSESCRWEVLGAWTLSLLFTFSVCVSTRMRYQTRRDNAIWHTIIAFRWKSDLCISRFSVRFDSNSVPHQTGGCDGCGQLWIEIGRIDSIPAIDCAKGQIDLSRFESARRTGEYRKWFDLGIVSHSHVSSPFRLSDGMVRENARNWRSVWLHCESTSWIRPKVLCRL